MQSSLWNLHHVRQPYDPQFLDDLEIAVESTANNFESATYQWQNQLA